MERYGPEAGRQVSKADRAGFTVHMVERALRHYKAKGREATVAYYNSPESVDGEWYVFIADENKDLIAHPNPPNTPSPPSTARCATTRRMTAKRPSPFTTRL